MKNNIGIQCATFIIGCISFIACSDHTEDKYSDINSEINELPVNFRISTADLPEDLQCKVYIFGKADETSDYILKDTINLDDQNHRILPFTNEEWSDSNYRFFFIALAAENPGLALTNQNYTELQEGVDTWENIRIKAEDTQMISGDCYFGVLDKTNQEISDSRLISGEIKRLVGQMAIDIFRVDDEGEPMDKLTSNISTVLDRVYQIDFAYTGLTDEISFDEDGDPQWLSVKTLTETSMDIQLADTLQMYLDENPLLSVSSEGVTGSVRVKNLFCLPSTGNVKLKVTFHYYDTTPICGDINHDHYGEEPCFVQRTLELNLPQNSQDKQYLDILPNYYTVNKAGIPMDRVIDLNQSASFGFNTIWENEK